MYVCTLLYRRSDYLSRGYGLWWIGVNNRRYYEPKLGRNRHTDEKSAFILLTTMVIRLADAGLCYGGIV